MARAFGIVTSTSGRFKVAGLQDYRPIGAFSFLGRYRVVDFPVSNMSNSGIDRVQVYVSQNPRSLAEHLGSGSHFNMNSKRGKLQLLFNQDSRVNRIYNTDIAAFMENINIIERMQQEYVVITSGYMIFKQDFNKLLNTHIETGADITMLYQKVEDAKNHYHNCYSLTLNRQKGIKSIEINDASVENANIFMDTYVMKTELLVKLIRKAAATSSIYTLTKMISDELDELDVRGVSHKGFFAAITDFQSYYNANMDLLNIDRVNSLFSDNWPIYTRTTDACPVRYYKTAKISNSMIANGCEIRGTVENSIIGHGVKVAEGAVVRNCIILGHSTIGEGVHVESQVVDKWAQVIRAKELVATPEEPGYIRRDDVL